MSWEISNTGVSSAEDNMAYDARLLETVSERTTPLLHLYGWRRPSITYGYFCNPAQFLHLDAVRELGIEMARRPTGGGITLHFGDLAFSALVPSVHEGYSTCTLANYAYVNSAVSQAIQECFNVGKPELLREVESQQGNFCMAQPTKYDVVLEGKKVGGAAQRRTKHGFLHQGTICLVRPDENVLRAILLDYDDIALKMLQHSLPLGTGSEVRLVDSLVKSLEKGGASFVCSGS